MESSGPASDPDPTDIDSSLDSGAVASAATAPSPTEVSGARAESKPATHGAFTVTEEGISWQCNRCDNVNPLEAQVCSVCGTTFADIVRPESTKPQRDPNMAALMSLFLPGAGHMYQHLWPQGIARAIVSLWVMSVVLVSLFAGGRNNSMLVGVTFGIVATALWVVGAHDAYREARGESAMVILKGKVFLYLVLGLLMLLFFLLMAAGLNARG